MNNTKEFELLAEDTKRKVKEFGTTSKRVMEDFDRCVRLLAEHLKINSLEFTLETGFAWLHQYKFNENNCTRYNDKLKRAFRRVILLLWDNKEGQLNQWKFYSSNIQALPKAKKFVKILNDYKVYLKKSDYADNSVVLRFTCAKGLLIFLEDNQIYTFDKVTNQLIADYFASAHFTNRKPSGVQAEAIRVKLFLEYLEDENIVNNKLLHYAVPRFRLQETKIIPTITPLAEEQILSDHPKLPSNKREKALCLLALHLGLRTCDIYNLKFDDIDWNTGTLYIKQQKTGVTIKMKIDNETQNAIIDYILNERRTSDCDYIFVTSKGPITKLHNGDKNIYRRTNRIDIKKNIPHQGLHIMRRTFASKLLRIGTPLPVISSALGHLDKEEVHSYLSTDEMKMKQCALDLTLIPFGRSEF